MGPLDTLFQEHNAVKVLVEILGEMCDRLEAKQKVEPEHIRSAVHFIRNFADKAHHLKEEHVLFPVMESAGVSKEEMLLEAITTEHDLGRGFVRGMSDALFPYSIGDNRAGEIIRENARKYIKLMTDHIGKEEEIVFPLAAARLSEGAQRELAQEFKRIDDEVIGRKNREEFFDIMRTLSGVYLVKA